MTIYGAFILIHVFCAVVGMGPAFMFPGITNYAKTKEQLQFVNRLLAKLETPVKIGSIGLLITGLIMGVLNPHLFKEIWYIGSLILYFVAQIFVIGIAAKQTKVVNTILDKTEGDNIPSDVLVLNQKINQAFYIACSIALFMIALMSLKPF